MTNERRKENREAMIDRALSGIPNNAFCYSLLAHHPEFFDEAIRTQCAINLVQPLLTFGQIILFGMPWVPIGTPYVKGRYTEKNRRMLRKQRITDTGSLFVLTVREITVITFFDGVSLGSGFAILIAIIFKQF